MKIKKYVVKDMNEAFSKIRYELGENAVIINQKKIKKPGIMGFFSKKLIEVTAASEESTEKKPENNKILEDSLKAIRNVVNTSMNLDKNNKYSEIKTSTKKNGILDENNMKLKNNGQHDKIKEEVQSTGTENLMKEMLEMKKILNGLAKVDNASQNNDDDIRIKLRKLDIEDEIIDYIIEKMDSIKEDISIDEKIQKIVEDVLKVSSKEMQGKIVFVGPTGVGKTTTIAKLAGRLSLMDNKSVGLITIDTYRIGAVEQLKTYADIMNLPFKVVFNIADMEQAVKDMEACDVVLIDTTGRSSKNFMQISELRAFIEKVDTKDINLVVSSTTKNKDIIPIINGYKKLNFSSVIVTKLDETTTYGSILNIGYYSDKKIRFITTGQNVPEDIKFMDSYKLCKVVLGEDNLC
ncbi:flagellar biosynthesis protein FlhF [Haloimpatiens sp. FM7315]|uniref:flagellar biosynthesis protein FlhF n=1 Tax=Haloimpatiens sp. FM7315 TaxID=3298609 RepID=UPI00370B56F7